MFKCALRDGNITINNPSIWRPILAVEDAVSAYTRAIEAHEAISGIFNITSGNYTVGEVGDLVKNEIEEQLNVHINLTIKHIKDVRNYKVNFEKAKNVLSFHPRHDVRSIVRGLVRNKERFSDWDNPAYYNIQMFRTMDESLANVTVPAPVGVGK